MLKYCSTFCCIGTNSRTAVSTLAQCHLCGAGLPQSDAMQFYVSSASPVFGPWQFGCQVYSKLNMMWQHLSIELSGWISHLWDFCLHRWCSVVHQVGHVCELDELKNKSQVTFSTLPVHWANSLAFFYCSLPCYNVDSTLGFCHADIFLSALMLPVQLSDSDSCFTFISGLILQSIPAPVLCPTISHTLVYFISPFLLSDLLVLSLLCRATPKLKLRLVYSMLVCFPFIVQHP